MLSELWIRITQTGSARLFGVVMGMATLFVTARWLGPSGRGEIAVITTWAGILAVCFGLSLGQVTLHRAAQAGRELWAHDALPGLLALCGALTLLAWGVAVGLHLVTAGHLFGDIDPLWLILGLLFVPVLIWEQYGSAFLQALNRLDIYNRLEIFGRASAAALVVTGLVVLDFGVTGVLVSNLLGAGLIASGSLYFLLRNTAPLGVPKPAQVRALLGDGARLHLNTLGAFLITSTDIVMLNYFHGSEATGFYQIGIQLLGIMLILPQVVAMVVYGRIAELGANGAWPTHRMLILQTTTGMLLLAALAGATAPWWLIAITGEAFLPSVGVYRWQLLALIGMTVTVLMAPQWIARGLFWQASVLTLTVGIGNVVANYLLIPRYGMYGAAWASIGCYVLAIIGNGTMFLYCNRAGQHGETGVTV